MTKLINKTKGKSDRHQLHEKKYATSHRPDALERWYTKITTPKPRNYKLHGRPVKAQPKPRKQADPQKKIDKIIRDTIRLSQYKRDTHWVARSQLEYDMMHNF